MAKKGINTKTGETFIVSDNVDLSLFVDNENGQQPEVPVVTDEFVAKFVVPSTPDVCFTLSGKLIEADSGKNTTCFVVRATQLDVLMKLMCMNGLGFAMSEMSFNGVKLIGRNRDVLTLKLNRDNTVAITVDG